jgi:CRISPR-associated protein Cas4
MEDYIMISELNDFIFCPYSIYLHNIYMGASEEIYHAAPQTRGKIAHETVDKKTASHSKNTLMGLSVYSEKYGLMGKIDVFHITEGKLIERKYQLKNIFQGQIFQLWAQMFCLKEMGYEVKELAFYETSTNKMIPVAMPDSKAEAQFASFIELFRNYNPTESLNINPNKCRHCIYSNLCDKTTYENVY